MRPDWPRLAKNLKNHNEVIISQHDVIVKYFDVVFFLLWRLVTGPNFMSISLLLLELWQFSFIRDWPEIRKSEIPPSEFCSISGDWGKLGIPNLARMSLMKCYWSMQNAKFAAFTVSEWGKLSPPPQPRLGVMG